MIKKHKKENKKDLLKLPCTFYFRQIPSGEMKNLIHALSDEVRRREKEQLNIDDF